MAILFQCPTGHLLKVEVEYAGKPVRCPLCLAIIVAPGVAPTAIVVEPAQPLPEVEEYHLEVGDDQPLPEVDGLDGKEQDDALPPRRRRDGNLNARARARKAKRRARVQQLRTVDTSLLLCWWKYLAILGSVGCALLIQVAVMLLDAPSFFGTADGSENWSAPTGPRLPALATVFAVIARLLFAGGALMGVIGAVLCCWVPPESKSRTLITVSMAFDIASVLSLIAALIFKPLILFCAVWGLVAFVLFMLFLRSLAYYLEDRPTGDEALANMTYILVTGIGGFVVLVAVAILVVMVVKNLIFARILMFAFGLGWYIMIFKGFLRTIELIQVLRARL